MSRLKVENLRHPNASTDALTLDASGNMSPAHGYLYHSTIYFTSSGTFAKADYPWLRAIRIKLVGGGGGSAGLAASANSAVPGAGGAGYAEKFFTDIASLGASVTVTVGAGGAGAAAANADGTDGGTSAFGGTGDAWLTRALGGLKSLRQDTGSRSPGDGRAGTVGDLLIAGQGGSSGENGLRGGAGGSSQLGGGGRASDFSGNENSARAPAGGYGGGAGGGRNTSTGAAVAGATGADGIVIVELFA